jgi:type II secretory pathway component PulJ
MKSSTQRSFDSAANEKQSRKRPQSTTRKNRQPREAETVEQSFDFRRTVPVFEPRPEYLLVAVIRRLLWSCGGFDPHILGRDECASVRPVYSSMGAAVVITAGFALCSSLYFFSTVLGERQARTFAGLWALSIFVTDRYIVSSTRKRAIMRPYVPGGGQRKLFWTSFPWVNALPRLLLGALVSLVIAAPLEVALQKSRIATARQEQTNEMRRALNVQAENTIQAATADLTRRADSLQNQLTVLKTALTDATKVALGEADGTSGTRQVDLGPVYRLKLHEQEKAATALEAARTELRPKIADIEREIAGKRAEIETKYREQIMQTEADHSFSADWETLEMLRAKSPAINLMSWGLTVVFLALELCPVLAKLFSTWDTYDSFLQNLEGSTQMANLAAEADERLKWHLWIEMREMRAAYLKRQMAALSETTPRPEGWRVVGNRASNEFRDVASDALRYRRPPLWSEVSVQKPRRIVVLFRESRARVMEALRRAGEFLKNSLSLMEALRWLGKKIFPWL